MVHHHRSCVMTIIMIITIVTMMTLFGGRTCDANVTITPSITSQTIAPLRVAWTRIPIPSDGSWPPASCDHTAVAINNNRLWLYGGGNDVGDGWANIYPWILDTNVEPPRWHQLVNESVNTPPTRSAVLAAYDPVKNGVFMYGGWTNLPESFLYDDIWIQNVSDWTWTNLIPPTPQYNGHATDGTLQPFGRGWSIFAMDPLQRELYLFGGNGVSAGGIGRYGVSDKDYDDLWIYSIRNNTWRSPTICASYESVCSDSTDMSAYYNLTAQLAQLTTVAATTDRPSQQSALLSQFAAILDQLRDEVTTATTLPPGTDDASACSQVCAAITKPAVYPPPTEGHRAHIIGNSYWQLFGYSCTADGRVVLGGPECFQDSVWQLDLTTGIWLEHTSATSTGDPANWPSARAYPATAMHDSRIWVVAGAYRGFDSVDYFYNDVHVWNTITLQWQPLNVGGDTHPALWSQTATIIGNKLYSYGGCTPSYYSDQLLVLELDATITVDELDATGDGLTWCRAGDICQFLLSARRWTNDTNGNKVWGDVIPSGSGLDITVTVVPSAANGLLQATVTDNKNGTYTITYLSILPSSSYKIYMWLDDTSITTEPYTAIIIPGAPVARRFSLVDLAIALVAASTETFIIHTADMYGNERTNSTGDDLTLLAITPVSLGAIITNRGDGTYHVTYTAPLTAGTFPLNITYDDILLGDSPYTCTIIASADIIAYQGDTLHWTFDGSYVVLSFGLSVLGSWTALILMEEVNVAVSRARRLVMGGGKGSLIGRCYRNVWFVWTVFVSLALSICAVWNNVTIGVASIRFQASNVTLSLGPLIIAALAASIVGIAIALVWIIRGQRRDAVAATTTLSPTYAPSKVIAPSMKCQSLLAKFDMRLLCGGLFIMIAAWVTQLLAMLSIAVPASVTISPGLSIVAAFIAFIVCTPALLLYLHFQSSIRWIAAFIMSVGICASTYAHLSSLHFVYDRDAHHDEMTTVGPMIVAASATTLACCFVLLGLNVQNLKLSRGALANQVKAVFASLESLKISRAAAVAEADKWRGMITLMQLMRPLKRDYAANLVALFNQHQASLVLQTHGHTGGITHVPLSPLPNGGIQPPTSPQPPPPHVMANKSAYGTGGATPVAASSPHSANHSGATTPIGANGGHRTSVVSGFHGVAGATTTTMVTTASTDGATTPTIRASPIRQPSSTSAFHQSSSPMQHIRTAASLASAATTSGASPIPPPTSLANSGTSSNTNAMLSPRSTTFVMSIPSPNPPVSQPLRDPPPLIGSVTSHNDIAPSPPQPAGAAVSSSTAGHLSLRNAHSSTILDGIAPPTPLIIGDNTTVTAFDDSAAPLMSPHAVSTTASGTLVAPPSSAVMSPNSGNVRLGTPLLPVPLQSTPLGSGPRNLSPHPGANSSTLPTTASSSPLGQYKQLSGENKTSDGTTTSGGVVHVMERKGHHGPTGTSFHHSHTTNGNGNNAPASLSLDQLLAHPVTLELLKDRVFTQSSGELIMFWLDASCWRRLPRSDGSHTIHTAKIRADIAASIVKLYISAGAPQQVNISHTLRQRIESSLATSIMDPKPTLFDDAIKEVYGLLLHNSLPSFMKTAAYETALEIITRFPIASPSSSGHNSRTHTHVTAGTATGGNVSTLPHHLASPIVNGFVVDRDTLQVYSAT